MRKPKGDGRLDDPDVNGGRAARREDAVKNSKGQGIGKESAAEVHCDLGEGEGGLEGSGEAEIVELVLMRPGDGEAFGSDEAGFELELSYRDEALAEAGEARTHLKLL